MKTFGLKEACIAAQLAVTPVIGYGFNAAVQSQVNSRRAKVAALAQGVELNSLVWGNGGLDPNNYWTKAMQTNEE
ncbi:hypothetical protein IPJ72_04585 [Candidatus Peregrinibacteria bacterium]|nr:MAG: hypothetical protein IPJ72_04585 [Candidatus Peregrinibacteria bacterium]